MPVISRFKGIVIRMNSREHNPPHFHVEYAGKDALVWIETLEVKSGKLPSSVLNDVKRWASQHSGELLENWKTLQEGVGFKKIAPLED